MRSIALLALLSTIAGCDAQPTEASVANDLPSATIEKAWFRTTLFAQPLESGEASELLRVGTGVEPAYAVVRIGAHAFVARTTLPARAEAGETLLISFSPATSRSLCFGEPRLDAEEEAFIRSRIFPGDAITSDPAQCDAP